MAWGFPKDSFNLQGISSHPVLSIGQKVKVNLPNGTQMANKPIGVITLLYSVKEKMKKNKILHVVLL